MYDTDEKAIAVQPPSSELGEELHKRMALAAERATTLEHEAREWRAVERACRTALGSLGEEEQEVSRA